MGYSTEDTISLCQGWWEHRRCHVPSYMLGGVGVGSYNGSHSGVKTGVGDYEKRP